MQSSAIASRGTQLILQKVGDKIIAIPVKRTLAMRPSSETDASEAQGPDSRKATKGEVVKQLEARLRTYAYQREVLALEPWSNLRLRKGDHGLLDNRN